MTDLDIRNGTKLSNLFISTDLPILEIIFRYKGAIFGGYIRDIIRDEEPNDIDVVISEMYLDNFIKKVESMGYDIEGSEGVFKLKKKGYRDIEVVSMEDDPDDVILGPAAAPDFSVNLLVFSMQDGLNEWTGEYKIDEIIKDIKRGVAVQISTDLPDAKSRQNKLTRKGFTVITMN